MKYPHASSRKSLVSLEVEIKLQHGTRDLSDRFDVWKASRRRKGGEYVNEEAKEVAKRIVSSLLLTKFILSLTDPQTLFAG